MILFSEDEIILAIRCYVQVVFPATPCHLMTLWKWKQQPVTRWLDSYITQNNKKDGTQPHDDDNVVVDARLLAPVMWRHRDKMANETNDFSTPHVGTSSYDFIALGSILKPLRRPTTTLFWMPYIWSPRWERVFYEASTIEFLKPFLVFLVSSVFKTLFESSIDCCRW